MSPSDCPVCAAVASGGRVRVTEESAQLLFAVLRDMRRRGVRERRSALTASDDSFVSEANHQLKLIDWLMEEIERTQVEKGWPTHGQLQRSNA
jgi:hypothetical protein